MRAWAGVVVVVFANFFGWVACSTTTGCGGAIRFYDDVNRPQDDVDLERCRNVMREVRDAGASEYHAYDVYYECTQEAGLR